MDSPVVIFWSVMIYNCGLTCSYILVCYDVYCIIVDSPVVIFWSAEGKEPTSVQKRTTTTTTASFRIYVKRNIICERFRNNFSEREGGKNVSLTTRTPCLCRRRQLKQTMTKGTSTANFKGLSLTIKEQSEEIM